MQLAPCGSSSSGSSSPSALGQHDVGQARQREQDGQQGVQEHGDCRGQGAWRRGCRGAACAPTERQTALNAIAPAAVLLPQVAFLVPVSDKGLHCYCWSLAPGPGSSRRRWARSERHTMQVQPLPPLSARLATLRTQRATEAALQCCNRRPRAAQAQGWGRAEQGLGGTRAVNRPFVRLPASVPTVRLLQPNTQPCTGQPGRPCAPPAQPSGCVLLALTGDAARRKGAAQAGAEVLRRTGAGQGGSGRTAAAATEAALAMHQEWVAGRTASEAPPPR